MKRALRCMKCEKMIRKGSRYGYVRWPDGSEANVCHRCCEEIREELRQDQELKELEAENEQANEKKGVRKGDS